MPSPVHHPVPHATIQRICAEFNEMPGLRLTVRQAQRLWGLDERTCRQSLGVLVDAGVLARTGDEAYVRSSKDRVPAREVRMAKAPLTPLGARHRSHTSAS